VGVYALHFALQAHMVQPTKAPSTWREANAHPVDELTSGGAFGKAPYIPLLQN